MSGRKHHTKHEERSRSHYPDRLSARGLARAPKMEDPDVLRRRQLRRKEETGAPWPKAGEL